MSNVHRQDVDNGTEDCALCLDPWPCPPAQTPAPKPQEEGPA